MNLSESFSRRIDFSESVFNIRVRSLFRQSTRSILDEFEFVDIFENVENEIIAFSNNKSKELETINVSKSITSKIDISNYVVYQKMMKKDSSKIVTTIRVANREELRRVFILKREDFI
jgi:hypothetical protein